MIKELKSAIIRQTNKMELGDIDLMMEELSKLISPWVFCSEF
jgi:hypothetical protein